MKKEKIIYNYNELKRDVIYKYGSLKAFATNVLQITPTYFSRILSSKVEYSQKFIFKTIEALNLAPEQVGFYFFTQELHEIA